MNENNTIDQEVKEELLQTESVSGGEFDHSMKEDFEENQGENKGPTRDRSFTNANRMIYYMIKHEVPISIHTRSRIRLQGKIVGVDSFVYILSATDNDGSEYKTMVYKSDVSSVTPEIKERIDYSEIEEEEFLRNFNTQSVQNKFLNECRINRTPVVLFLSTNQDGSENTGSTRIPTVINAFDDYSIVTRSKFNQNGMIIHKSAISTVTTKKNNEKKNNNNNKENSES